MSADQQDAVTITAPADVSIPRAEYEKLRKLKNAALQYLKAAEAEFGHVDSDGSSSAAELELNEAIFAADKVLWPPRLDERNG